tara:strand:- start:238 stop:861 length:624 start_codon:yes stop_codon:yes gene_type:complete
MIKLKNLLLEDRFTVEFDIGSQGLMSKTVDAKNSKEAAKKVTDGIRGKVKIKKVSKVVNEANKSFGVYKWVGSAGKVVGMYNTANGARSQIAKMEKKDPQGKYQLIKFESINEAPAQNIKDQYVGEARVRVEPNTYKKQIRNYHSVSMYRDHRKPYNYYLSIILAHNKTNKIDMIISTGTHILSKAGKWAQGFMKRRMNGTGKERFD